MHWWFDSRKLSIVYCIFLVASRKCMQCIERNAWNENENVNKTKSDSLFMSLRCHINTFYQFIARDPPKIIEQFCAMCILQWDGDWDSDHIDITAKNWWIYEIDQP